MNAGGTPPDTPAETWLGINSENGTALSMVVYDYTGAGNDIGSLRTVLGSALSLNTWYHVVGTYNGGSSPGDVKLYLNGVLQNTTDDNTLFSSIKDVSVPFTVGQVYSANAPAYFFPGQIDEVRIYNRVLSADEIKRLYRIGAGTHIGTSANNDSLKNGLVGYWSFDGNSVVSTSTGNGAAMDLSGNGHTAYFTPGAVRTIGKIGQGLYVKGPQEYADAGDIDAMDGATQLTMAAWMRRAVPSGPLQVCKEPVPWVIERTCISYNADERVFFNLNNGVNSNADSRNSNLPNDTNWHHVVMVFNGNGASDADKVKGYLTGHPSKTYSFLIPCLRLPHPTRRIY